MNCLVTGGAGFIGYNLAKKCVENMYNTTIVDHDSDRCNKISSIKAKIINKDFASQEVIDLIKSKTIDVVFHLAALPRVEYSVEHPAETHLNNVQKTVELLEACRNNIDKFIFASSCAVYGDAFNLPTIESNLLSPNSPYALHKKQIEETCLLFSRLYKMNIVSLRYFNVYGEGQLGDSPYSTAVSAWLDCIKNNKPLRKDGDGNQSRDMVYVKDVVEANILVANSKKTFKGECFNVGSGKRISNNQILDILQSKFGKLNIVNAPERPGDVKHTLADLEYIEKELGYQPSSSFEDGLNNTINWYMKN